VASIQPRVYESQKWESKDTIILKQNELRNATEQELYDAGFTVKDVVINGRDCLEKQNKIYWCEEL
jgi:hypothetical protein